MAQRRPLQSSMIRVRCRHIHSGLGRDSRQLKSIQLRSPISGLRVIRSEWRIRGNFHDPSLSASRPTSQLQR